MPGKSQYGSGDFPALPFPGATGFDSSFIEDESGSDNDGEMTMEEEMQKKKVSVTEKFQFLQSFI